MLRCIGAKMELPIAVGTHKLGQDLMALLKLKLQSWESWSRMQAHIAQCQTFLLSIIRDDN